MVVPFSKVVRDDSRSFAAKSELVQRLNDGALRNLS